MALAQNIATWLAHRGIEASILIAFIFLIRWVLGRQLPLAWKCALWLIVAIRLLTSGIIPLHASLPDKIASITDLPPVVVHVDLSSASSATSPTPTVNVLAKNNLSPILIASLLYLAIAIILLLRIISKHLLLASHIRRMPLADTPLTSLLSNCQRQMRISRQIRLVQTDQIRTPALSGIFRPTIMLPANASLSQSELRMVLMHELAHAKKNHVLVGLLTQILCALHWLNLMIWLAAIAYRHDRELLCDELVLKQLGKVESENYGQCLIRMVKSLSSVPSHPATIGVFGSPNFLRRRIDMISNFNNQPAHFRWIVGAITFIALGCGALTTTGQSNNIPPQPSPNQSNHSADHPATNTADAPTQQALERRLPEVKFDQTPFTDAIDFYRNITGTNIFVNWRVLETAGIEKDSPITFQLRDVKFSTALQKTLDDLGGGTVKLDYTVDDGVITISTAADLARNVVTRVYDVRDLLAEIGDVQPFKPTDKNKPTTAPVANKSRQERSNQLISLITQTIAPNSWRDAGGVTAAIRDFNAGQLIITQTPQNQAAIASLLEELREGRAIQICVEARFLTLDPHELSPKFADMLRPVEPGHAPASPFVSGPVVNEILRDSQKTTQASIITAPRMTLFNGQRGLFEVGTTTNYVAGIKVTRQPNDETHLDPVIGDAFSGLTVAIQATASADHRYVTVSVQPNFKQLKGLVPETLPGSSPRMTIQHAQIEEQSLNLTASIPDGETVILRTAPANLYRTDPADKDSKQMLFIMLTPKIIVQKEVASVK